MKKEIRVMSTFIFNDRVKPDAVDEAVCRLGIKSKAALLEALSVTLSFPDYFGGNWDALGECICDLSWLPPGDMILRHEDLPMAEDRAALSTYLSILQDAVETWNATGSYLIYASSEKWDATGQREFLVKRK